VETVLAAENIEECWVRCKEHGDPAAREELIVHYLPLVKQVAGRVAMGLPPHVDSDDLVGQGMLGLIDAVDKFDHKRGVKFETYAIMRIRGSMLDGLRRADWVPHSLRARVREVEEAYIKIESERGRSASDEEVAEELDMTLSDFHSLLSDLSYMSLSSLDDYLGGTDDEGTPRLVKSCVADTSSRGPLEAVEWEEKKAVLADAIRRLPDKERLVVALYYYEGLIAREIAEVMDLSPSRISQLHTKAILRLRGRLGRIKADLVG